MRFQIERDTKRRITGWVVLDRPDAVPKIRVSTSDRPPIEIEATLARPKLVARGLHSTGIVGFQIDKTIVPDLAKLKEIELRNVDTGVLIYRRPQKQHIPAKMFRYELQAMPQIQLDLQFGRYFTMSYHALERFSPETTEAVLSNRFSSSIYASGRIPLNRYLRILGDCGFCVITSLRDPYEELAERLLFLRYAAGKERPAYIADYLTGFEPLLPIAQQFDITNDSTTLHRIFEKLDGAQKDILSNPFVRLLACEPDELPTERHIETALYNLASFNLVGLHSRYNEFRSMMQEYIQVDILERHQPQQVSWAPVVAERLAQIDEVKQMLALDVELYGLARDAIEDALGRS